MHSYKCTASFTSSSMPILNTHVSEPRNAKHFVLEFARKNYDRNMYIFLLRNRKSLQLKQTQSYPRTYVAFKETTEL